MQRIFDNLRSAAIGRQVLGRLKPIGFVPRVTHPSLCPDLTKIVAELLNQSRSRKQFVLLNSQNGGLGLADFRDFDGTADWQFHFEDPMHIFNHERGRFDNIQWNIGFTVGDTSTSDFVRVGLGVISEGPNSIGRQSYELFADRVKNKPADFNHLMGGMSRGGYAEFDGTVQEPVQANWLLNPMQRRLITGVRWRFVGERLLRQQIESWSPSQFVSHCLDVYEAFLQAGFPARY